MKSAQRKSPGAKTCATLPIVTIDGENARDFDDAVYVRRNGQGYELFVSIADVAHYVRPETALDQEAYARATSVYFPDRAIPMLPEALSNGICSLNPDEDRLTKTAWIEFNGKGEAIRSRFFDSVIRSHARMTYTKVRRILVDKDPECLVRYRDLSGRLQTDGRAGAGRSTPTAKRAAISTSICRKRRSSSTCKACRKTSSAPSAISPTASSKNS